MTSQWTRKSRRRAPDWPARKWDYVRWALINLALATAIHILLAAHRLSHVPLPWFSDELEVLGRQPQVSSTSSSSGGAGSAVSDQCSVYLAPSSIADADDRPAGFGVFTTRPITKGEYIFPRGTGPVVPITDLETNNGGKKPSFAKNLFMPKCLGMGIETDQPAVGAYPKGKSKSCRKSNNNVGSLSNYHPMLLNVKVDDTDNYQDNLLSRHTDPGAGAFSYWMGERWHASREIEAGEEIFNDYEEHWFFDKVLHDEERKIPRVENYMKAARTIDAFVGAYGTENITQNTLGEFMEEVNGAEAVDNTTWRLISLVASGVDAFTETTKLASEYANRSVEYNSTWRLARGISRRSLLNHGVAYLKTNGRCLDNIYPGRSTLPQAGQGGFASRPLKKGDIIAPLPTLVVVTNRTMLSIYHHVEEKPQGKRKGKAGKITIKGTPYTQQLLVNYCFGHDESSLLLCPATNANLLNHCSARTNERIGQCNPKTGPNAILRWAKEFDPDTPEWLTYDIDTINEKLLNGLRGLSLEVVALRDIAPDEEIFLDYGASWQEAWERHVSSWQPSSDDQSFVPVSDMNLDVDKYLLTKIEQAQGAKYPHKNVRVGCRVEGSYHPCEVLKRVKGTIYTVSVRRWDDEGENYGDFDYHWPFAKNDTATVECLSSSSIKFFAGPYSSDQHLEGAFRHHIGVAQGMWPEQWINLK